MKKASSLMAKVLQMIEEDKYCIDVIQQNLAIIGLLRSANTALLEGHMNHCVKNAVKQKQSGKVDEMMEELLKVLRIAQTK
ncbi:metal-sensing transcriptional repressor [Candidatus Peregrinibacteria bacterium]|nr:metal-sensing transcriptional repressor [Candidatus Peregrinibacteria bacterium]MBT4148676.1 metal-sensing transcriptional repressor [Candidatus Peregrinibacteria bacterium]MBT4366518.1 metal-sensing transcriptional repressor [Candidatus Peregrinibacteria bacterium]MBT4456045.1 metal-sensing transcriptional repressor [Candidatus Peregrinibacteria bacterium]